MSAAAPEKRNLTLRSVVGRLVDLYAAFAAAMHVHRYRVLSRFGVMTFQHASESIGRSTTFVGCRVRQRFYSALLDGCGERLEINHNATIAEQASQIGDRVWIGPRSYLDLVVIGDDVLIGPNVAILSGGRHHRMDDLDVPIRHQGNNPLRATRIGDGAWIGANAVVMADVGRGAVVGAGAVVSRPVDEFTVVAGNPARLIRGRRAEAGR
jgi:acetyltransferase-like isoleucine patch superfamily enzyme